MNNTRFTSDNLKSGVNRHLRFYPFPKNWEMRRVWCHGLTNITHPHTAHFRVFWKWKKPQVPIFTPDLRLCKSNTAQDEGISTNSQTQH